MTRFAAMSSIVASLLIGCAVMDSSKMHAIQSKLSCGMSQGEVEAVVGERLKRSDQDRRATHYYRSGMADLWMVFVDDQLHSSQIINVKGFTGTEEEPVVDHCR